MRTGDDGPRWVATTLGRIAAQLEVSINRVEWLPQNADDHRKMVQGLEFYISIQRHVIDFSYEELNDCVNTPSVQQELQARIRTALGRFRSGEADPPRKIGF